MTTLYKFVFGVLLIILPLNGCSTPNQKASVKEDDLPSFAADFLGPLHEETAFEELVDHQFLSPDFLVQSSLFSGGTEVLVNLGPTPFKMQSGFEVPPYGFRITKPDRSVVNGRFQHQAVVDGARIAF